MSVTKPRREVSAYDPHVPVSRLVEILGAELTDLAGLADALQDVVAEIALSPELPRPSVLAEAQSLDLVVQRLRALASFLQRVAPGLDPAWSVDPSAAARQITLASLASRFSAEPPIAATAAASRAGDCDLF